MTVYYLPFLLSSADVTAHLVCDHHGPGIRNRDQTWWRLQGPHSCDGDTGMDRALWAWGGAFWLRLQHSPHPRRGWKERLEAAVEGDAEEAPT